MSRRFRARGFLGCALLSLAASAVCAPPPSAPIPDRPATLKEAFEAAWVRQPEAQSLDLRRDAASARREIANRWTPEAPAIDVLAKTDQLTGDHGAQEYEAGIAVPLWLPGERLRAGALADAQLSAASSRALAARLRVAEAVREAWWLQQRAQVEIQVVQARLANARQLAVDVARRVRAGDLAQADQRQADGAVASAQAALAESARALAAARQQLHALTGIPVAETVKSAAAPEPLPQTPADLAALQLGHPSVGELADRTQVAQRETELAAVRRRANPELTLAATRERDEFGARWGTALTLGVRIPLGSDARHRARVADAQAELIETEGELQLERGRLRARVDGARERLEASRIQLAAAERRAALARETRSFFEKSFRLGETDLPRRLLIELEAAEANRQVSLTRIEVAAAISALRQALGLLPE